MCIYNSWVNRGTWDLKNTLKQVPKYSFPSKRERNAYYLVPAVSQSPNPSYTLSQATLTEARRGVIIISFYIWGFKHRYMCCQLAHALGLCSALLTGYYHALMEQTPLWCVTNETATLQMQKELRGTPENMWLNQRRPQLFDLTSVKVQECLID